MTSPDEHARIEGEDQLDKDRRKFLAACGKFAVITPPALTVLLSTSLNSEAIARSGGGGDRDPHPGPGGHQAWDWLKRLERLLDKWF